MKWKRKQISFLDSIAWPAATFDNMRMQWKTTAAKAAVDAAARHPPQKNTLSTY